MSSIKRISRIVIVNQKYSKQLNTRKIFTQLKQDLSEKLVVHLIVDVIKKKHEKIQKSLQNIYTEYKWNIGYDNVLWNIIIETYKGM